MAIARLALATGLLAVFLSSCSSSEQSLEGLFNRRTGTITLPPGPIEIRRPLRLPPNAHDIQIVGSAGTVLRALPDFTGKALLMIQNAERVHVYGFAIDGARKAIEKPIDIAPDSSAFMIHFSNNGILIDDSKQVRLSDLEIREVAGFPVLASRTKGITVEKVKIEDSGGHNGSGRNNTTGGILLEEGTDNFTVRDCQINRVLGNGVWTHSTFLSPRNYSGVIENNSFNVIGRDAIQVGHANRVKVLNNRGRFIGYPFDAVDIERRAIPVAVDTAGKVDESLYSKNSFEEVNGKCFDLDGFHDGEVSENTCINKGAASDYPHGQYALVLNNTYADMKSESITIRDNVFDGTRFGGIFLLGNGHKVLRNKLRNLNKWHCNEGTGGSPCPAGDGPERLLEAGIFLGDKAHRIDSARQIVIEDNEISGFRMQSNCILSSKLVDMSSITVRNNHCTNTQ
jgi:hypothetical protein